MTKQTTIIDPEHSIASEHAFYKVMGLSFAELKNAIKQAKTLSLSGSFELVEILSCSQEDAHDSPTLSFVAWGGCIYVCEYVNED